MRYLVTGGAGFIGSNLVEELLLRGETVRVLDNFSTGKKANIEAVLDKIELVEGDIRSYHIVKDAMSSVDIVLHQAALPSVPRSIRDPITSNEVNVAGTMNILDAAREAKVKKVVFASSSSIYGNNPELPKHEGMIPDPLSPYAVSKLAAEKYCGVFSKIYGLPTIALRYFNVFGPRQDPSSQYSAVIPKFIVAMMNDQQPIIYGDGEQSRDFTYVANVVHANLLAANTESVSGIAMNSACHQRITLNELVRSLNEILNKNLCPIYKEERSGDVKHSFANNDFAGKMIHYSPQINFREGLQKTVSYFLNPKQQV
jgi:nucleoside-diphosphate-sugar epimerase